MLIINFSRSIDVFSDLLKTRISSSYIITFEVNSMSFLKKHTEIIFSYIIGIVSLFTGLIILINLPLIKQLNGDKKVNTHVYNIWEFLNAFFAEIIKVMSRFIGVSQL